MTDTSARPSSWPTARRQLLEHRSRLLHLFERNERDATLVNTAQESDWAERAATTEGSEVLNKLTDRERRELVEIDGALKRIELGTYGLCTHCGEKIAAARLKALPQARTCLTCGSRERS